jgi:hypothetical protein
MNRGKARARWQISTSSRHHHNAAEQTGGEKHGIRLVSGEPVLGRLLPSEIDLRARRGQDRAVFAGEPPHNGRARQPAMTGDEDALSAKIE